MGNRNDLRGAFGSLSDTLLFRFDPGASEELRAQWLGTVNLHASIARRTADWIALAFECEAYDRVIAALNGATSALVISGSEIETLAALDQARAAIHQAAGLLDANPCAGEHA